MVERGSPTVSYQRDVVNVKTPPLVRTVIFVRGSAQQFVIDRQRVDVEISFNLLVLPGSGIGNAVCRTYFTDNESLLFLKHTGIVAPCRMNAP